MKAKPILFLDRDGTILVENDHDCKIKTLDRFHFMPNVIEALLSLAKLDRYYFVLVTNQDGLGRDYYPMEYFQPFQKLMETILASQGIHFYGIHIDTTEKIENSPTRKPNLGMLTEYLANPNKFDLPNSVVIGDRRTDVKLAKNLGCSSILIENELHKDYNNTITEEEAKTIIYRSESWKSIQEFLLKRQLP